MSLQVNWNWRMPTMVDAAAVANKNNDLFMQGAKGIADSITKGKEREQNQQQFEARQAQDQQQFADQLKLRRDQMDQEARFKNRDFWETNRVNTAKIQDMQDAMAIKQRQQQFNEMAYNKMYGDTPQGQEMAALQQALGNDSPGMQELQALMNDPIIKQYLQQQEAQNNASAILYGLNPQFSNLR
ncbi:MAG: hypothetical protein IIT61_04160 [Bacteroidales bacterium]|nr:hypothetical protein [Bacteroidales bacterium]